MKKVFLSLAVLACVAMVSCKKADTNVEEATPAEATEEVAEEAAAPVEEVAEEAAPAEEQAENAEAPAEEAPAQA